MILGCCMVSQSDSTTVVKIKMANISTFGYYSETEYPLCETISTADFKRMQLPHFGCNVFLYLLYLYWIKKTKCLLWSNIYFRFCEVQSEDMLFWLCRLFGSVTALEKAIWDFERKGLALEIPHCVIMEVWSFSWRTTRHVIEPDNCPFIKPNRAGFEDVRGTHNHRHTVKY